MSTFESRVAQDVAVDGVSIWVGQKAGDQRLILHLAADGQPASWEKVDPAAAGITPTLRLTDDVARALLDGLIRYYEGGTDLRTVRADLMAERARVDRLLGAILARIAKECLP